MAADDFERVRGLLWGHEQQRLEDVEKQLSGVVHQLNDFTDLLADSLEKANLDPHGSRLARALAESTAGSLDRTVRKRPESIVQAIFPIIGPSIRRALQEALLGLAHDLDQALQDTFSLRALRWRLEAWRTGLPYAQVALRHRLPYRVEHLFLIQADSGLLLDYVSSVEDGSIDVDAVAGMLAAIGQFVNDSVSAGDESGGLDSASVGEYRLLVSKGLTTVLAAFVRGVPPRELKTRLDELLEQIHATNGMSLAEPELHGRGTLLPENVIVELSKGQAIEGRSCTPRRSPVIATTVVGFLLAVGMGLSYVNWRHRQELDVALNQVPSVVVLDLHGSGYRKTRVHAFYDPGVAASGLSALRAKFGPAIQWHLVPYISADPAHVAQRLRRQLTLPDSVAVAVDASGGVQLRGTVPFRRWYEMTRLGMAPGGIPLDSEQLEFPGRAELFAQLGRIQAHNVTFASGTRLSERGQAELVGLITDIKALATLADAQGIALSVRTFGYTDELGEVDVNRELRLRRAGWLADKLAQQLPVLVHLDISPETVLAGEFHGQERAARVRIQLKPGP